MFRVYVCGSSKEIERAESVIATLRALGAEVTHDWPARMRALGPEADLTRSVLLAELRTDLAGVRSAHALLFLEPTTQSTGAWAELGYAAGLGTVEIVCCGPKAPSPWVHAFMPVRSFALDVMAIDYLAGFARRAREVA